MPNAQFLGACLVEGNPTLTSQQRRSRLRAVATSLSLQGVIVAAVVVVPMLATAYPPRTFTPTAIVSYGGKPKTPGTPPGQRQRPAEQVPMDDTIVVPREIPAEIHTGPEVSSVQTSSTTGPVGDGKEGPRSGSEIPGGLPPRSEYTPVHPIFSTPPPAKIPVTPQRVQRHESILRAQNIHRVQPQYTPMLRQMKREGTVLIRAIIGKDGVISEVRLESGDAFLAQEAMRAIAQWRYRPTLLNGVPVEVETVITVVFKLSQ